MATNFTYSHSEIQRYLQKEMSPAEMHAFEKEMMSDPFLADALEGFQQSDANVSTQHLTEIKKEINPKKEEAKVVGFGATTKWLRIAAIFLVLAGAGAVTYNIFDKGETTELAANEKSTSLEVDSFSAAEKPLAQQQGLPGKAANDNTIKSSPVIKDMQPEQNESAPLAMSKKALDTNSLAMMDTTNQRQAAGLDEVTISAARAPKEMMKDARTNTSTQPKEGWVHFQTYVDKEVNKAKEKNSTYAGNKVELEFGIDNEGNATDIKIIKTSNPEVAKVATEILRKSPRWTPSANNAKARIVINF
jgi:hypothetical protein